MIDLSKRFALLETGEIEPLFYEDGDPRDAYEDEDGKFYLCHDVYFESPGIRGWALRRDEIIATSDNEDVLAEITASATMQKGGLTMATDYTSEDIRKICGNCTSFEKPVLECLQGKCHYFGKQTIDRFALEDACVSFSPNCGADMRKVVEIDQVKEDTE